MQLADLGFMGMMVSPSYGGAGMDTISYVLAMEEISKIDASVSVCMSVNNSLVTWGLDKYATEEQKQNTRCRWPREKGWAVIYRRFLIKRAGSRGATLPPSIRPPSIWAIITCSTVQKNWITKRVFCKCLPGNGADRCQQRVRTASLIVENTGPALLVGAKEKNSASGEAIRTAFLSTM